MLKNVNRNRMSSIATNNEGVNALRLRLSAKYVNRKEVAWIAQHNPIGSSQMAANGAECDGHGEIATSGVAGEEDVIEFDAELWLALGEDPVICLPHVIEAGGIFVSRGKSVLDCKHHQSTLLSPLRQVRLMAASRHRNEPSSVDVDQDSIKFE